MTENDINLIKDLIGEGYKFRAIDENNNQFRIVPEKFKIYSNLRNELIRKGSISLLEEDQVLVYRVYCHTLLLDEKIPLELKQEISDEFFNRMTPNNFRMYFFEGLERIYDTINVKRAKYIITKILETISEEEFIYLKRIINENRHLNELELAQQLSPEEKQRKTALKKVIDQKLLELANQISPKILADGISPMILFT